MSDDDADLRALLETLDPKARDDLRRFLIRDQADRDAIASELLRYRDGHGDDWAGAVPAGHRICGKTEANRPPRASLQG